MENKKEMKKRVGKGVVSGKASHKTVYTFEFKLVNKTRLLQ